MFRKYQLAVWLSIQNFYSHFTKVTRICECFGRIVVLSCYLYKVYLYIVDGNVFWLLCTCVTAFCVSCYIGVD
jgi:hypothetical protein